MTILYVGVGGALGAIARYLLSGLVQRAAGGAFPWGTLAVNIVGALLMGLIVEAAARLWQFSPDLRIFLTTGILGGFTTFSAFTLETALMIEKGDWASAMAYIAASVTLCVLSLFAGLWLIRMIAT